MVILVACVLLIATVGYTEDLKSKNLDEISRELREQGTGFTYIFEQDKETGQETMRWIGDKDLMIDLIKEFAAKGWICEVFGHQWGEAKIVRPHGTYRKCEVCGKEQLLTEAHWDDFE